MHAELRTHLARLIVGASLGACLAYFDAFHIGLGPLARLGFWVGVVGGGSLVAPLVSGPLRKLLPRALGGLIPTWLVVSAALSIPMVVLTVAALALAGIPTGPSGLGRVVPRVFVAVLLVTSIQMLIRAVTGAHRSAPEAPSLGPAAERPALTLRLPPSLKDGAILALEAEDHYVRVHTSRGAALLLLRFSDAINEAAPVPGAQIHRSWWAAWSAIERIEADGRRKRVVLQGGLTAPLSRSGEALLRAKGWL